MSRSYKKNPIVKDNKRSSAKNKQIANHQVRQFKRGISNGKAYKKISNSYEIHDYVSRRTWQDNLKRFNEVVYEYLNGVLSWNPEDDDSYSYKNWARHYLYK